MQRLLTLTTAVAFVFMPLVPSFAETTPAAGDGALRAQADQLHQEGAALRAKHDELQKEREAHHQKVEALRTEAQAKRQANLAERKAKLEQRLSDVNGKMNAPVATPAAAVK